MSVILRHFCVEFCVEEKVDTQICIKYGRFFNLFLDKKNVCEMYVNFGVTESVSDLVNQDSSVRPRWPQSSRERNGSHFTEKERVRVVVVLERTNKR